MDKARIYDETWTRVTGHSRIWGTAKDPYTIFVYWEVDNLCKELLARHFQSAFDMLPLYLCVYDVTGRLFDGWNAPLVLSQRIASDAESWYLNNLSAGRDYIVDLATTTIDNQFFSILQTGTVRLPNTAVSSAKMMTSFLALSPAPTLDIQQIPTEASRHASATSCSQIPYQDMFDGYHVVERGEAGSCRKDI